MSRPEVIDLNTTEGKAAFLKAQGQMVPSEPVKNRKVSAKAKQSGVPKGMNKLEQRMNERLQGELDRREIVWFGYECLTFKLANDTRYTPDFIVIYRDGTIEARETKGFWRDDAKVKIKVAAGKFTWLTFAAYQFKGGIWTREEY